MTVASTNTGTQHSLPHASLYSGPNFSGRTERIRDALQAMRRTGPTCLLPPEVDEALSGLAPTVDGELALGRRRSAQSTKQFREAFCFDCDREQNPLTLSGGEKVLLVLLAAHARGCCGLGVDVALEQLDVQRRRRFLQSVPAWLDAGTSLFIADNRMLEMNGHHMRHIPMCPKAGTQLRMSDLPALPTPRCDPQELVLDGVQFGYRRERPILRNVCASLQPGAVYHVEGSNGSGKSTLAKLLIGRLRPWAGSIRYGRLTARPWNTPGRFAAYHFQDPDVQLFTTRVGHELSGERDSDSRALAHSFGLADLLDRHPFDLPYVLRKRLALAAVIAANAPWLVIDEPTLGQDDATAACIASMLLDLAGRGRGIIVISHSPTFVSRLKPISLMLTNGILSGPLEN